MVKKFFIANWKMNLDIKAAQKFINQLDKKSVQLNEVVIAAPFTFLASIKETATKKKIKLSAQDVSSFGIGPYTGEISAKMLKETGCQYCLVGHSERRLYFKENDWEINKKIKNLISENIRPILCIGENLDQRRKRQTEKTLKKQLNLALKNIDIMPLIAYEPVWAISTFQKGKIKKAASSVDIIKAHKLIKNILRSKSRSVKVLYGGTVNPQNSKEILSLKEVDGALVGGASLKSFSFNAIIKST